MALSVISNGSNQTVLVTERATVLFSYSTPVAACVDGCWFRTSTKYSVTTSRHINAWLDGRKAELRDPAWFQDLVGN